MLGPERTNLRNDRVNVVPTQRSNETISVLCSWTCRKLSVGNITLKISYVLEKKGLHRQGFLKLVEINSNHGKSSKWKSQNKTANISFEVIVFFK